ncbi:diacylglycerol kinase family protein [Pedobacter frigoris]|uniref:Diacylglycerol kinase family protein n=2 Tax=Pedobacter frigoris TaxID=2571272 RepID=A0A4U1CMU9_9SPHI|nr:diacylglycerol kinase family protein [Pedobacter frigoris]
MQKFFNSFKYAFSGLHYAFKTQFNFKFHTVAVLVAGIAGWILKLSTAEWLWVIAAISTVLISELLNTAIEVLVDLVSPSYNEKAKIIKDVSAGAVLIAAVFAVAVALMIFIPKLA